MATNTMEGLKEKTGLVKRPVTIAEQLEILKPQLGRVLSRSMNPDRLIRIALTQLRINPKLAECEAQSVLACVMLAAQLNLEFGVFGQCYMVPYKGVATFVPGWQGWTELVSRSGRAAAWTGEVREGDEFDASLGSKPFVHHKPDFNGDEDRNLLYTYAVGKQTGAEHPVIEVWGKQRLDKHLRRYNKVGDRHYALKDAHSFVMYGRKIPLLQVVKYLPKSVEMQAAANLDYSSDSGRQKPTIEMASTILDGEYTAEGSTVIDQKEKPSDIAAAYQFLDWTVDEQKKHRKLHEGLADAAYLAELQGIVDQRMSEEQ